MGVSKDNLKDAIRKVLKGKDRDFGSVTVKKARQWVEEVMEVDLSGQKEEFKELLVEVIEELRSKEEPHSSGESSVEDEVPKKRRGRPPTKAKERNTRKRKEQSDEEEEDDDGHDDEYVARNLHNELNSSGRTKKERGRKRKSRKETDDKGDKPRRNTGLNAPQVLSPRLQALMGGVAEMPRTEVVKQLWVLIRERGLQDPNNKRTILCDQDFQEVFGCEQMDMFKMNKLLSNHLKGKADTAT